MSHSPQAQKAKQKRQPVEYDDADYPESLLECINSGQVEPNQIVAHVAAGDVRESDFQQGGRDGRNTEN